MAPFYPKEAPSVFSGVLPHRCHKTKFVMHTPMKTTPNTRKL